MQETSRDRFVDSKELINKFLESRLTGQLVLGRFHLYGLRVNQDFARVSLNTSGLCKNCGCMSVRVK